MDKESGCKQACNRQRGAISSRWAFSGARADRKQWRSIQYVPGKLCLDHPNRRRRMCGHLFILAHHQYRILALQIVFGMIIGGALGNLLDRALRNGAVVDFISFRIPDINFYFAIFNVADACISVGVIALFLLVVLGKNSSVAEAEQANTNNKEATTSNIQSGNHQDA